MLLVLLEPKAGMWTAADCTNVKTNYCKSACSSNTCGGLPPFCKPLLLIKTSLLVPIKYKQKMKTNEISAKVLNTDARSWIEILRVLLLIQDKGKGTVKNYTGEMILLFKYYNSKTVATITQEDIQQYLIYIKTVHLVGRAKCRSAASACAFFYKQVIKMPYVLPSALYPQKQFILPNIMSQQEVTALFAAQLTLKEYCVIGLLYGSG